LRQLAEAEAEKILDNVDLIQSLEYAKTTAKEINERIAESTILEEEINRVRNEYKTVSIRGSVLYFVIKDLSLIDPMY
jgi:dynein heavy chain